MSRYEVPTRNEHYEVIVGWDPPLDTFFAQVLDHRHGHEDDGPVWWIGDRRGEVPTLSRLEEALAPYAILPLAVQAQLGADSLAPHEPVAPQIAQLLDLFERAMEEEDCQRHGDRSEGMED